MDFSFTTLGTASARPTSGRFPSAHILTVGGRLFLIDCGEGAQMQLVKCRVSIVKIDSIFISHLHGDHIFGLYGLLSTADMLGRTSALHIYGPGGIEEYVNSLSRLLGELSYPVEFHIVSAKEPLLIQSFSDVDIYAFPLCHRIETYGYLFKGKWRNAPRSFAYCSDTMPFAELPMWLQGTHMIYHEATYASDLEGLARTTAHSTAADAARCAASAGAKALVLGHYSSRYKTLDLLLADAQKIFPDTYLGEDGKIFDITSLTADNEAE